METVGTFINTLPQGSFKDRILALIQQGPHALLTNPLNGLDEPATSMADALQKSMRWSDSTEGHDFWYGVWAYFSLKAEVRRNTAMDVSEKFNILKTEYCIYPDDFQKGYDTARQTMNMVLM